MDFSIVVEGVETASQARFLKEKQEMNASRISLQGFLYSKPSDYASFYQQWFKS
jgi:sensor c-di-GMP phosphodiesterase-like protein